MIRNAHQNWIPSGKNNKENIYTSKFVEKAYQIQKMSTCTHNLF